MQCKIIYKAVHKNKNIKSGKFSPAKIMVHTVVYGI